MITSVVIVKIRKHNKAYWKNFPLLFGVANKNELRGAFGKEVQNFEVQDEAKV